MACLHHFNGWTASDSDSEATIRKLVAELWLRPLSEPGDIDSPLLRSQIDEQYLRAMASARAQMAGVGSEERRSSKTNSNRSSQQTPVGRSKKGSNPQSNVSSRMYCTFVTTESHPNWNSFLTRTQGHPPAYPRGNMSPRVPGQPGNQNGAQSADMRRQRWNYPSQPPQWWGGWHPQAHPHFYGDDASVQSGLSGDSYPQPYDMGMYPGPMHHPYYPPMMYPPQHQPPPPGQPMPFDASMQDPRMFGMEGYNTEHFGAMPWSLNNQEEGGENPESPKQPKTPSTSTQKGGSETGEETAVTEETQVSEQSPYKYNPSSPYWGHLDHTTLAMMGIATPQGISTPQTPHRGGQSPPDGTAPYSHAEDPNGGVVNAQPLLLRQQYHSYGYYGNRDAYGPPSPATQFMMSPQANFAYAYGAYSGYSPSQVSPKRNLSPSVKKRLDTSEPEDHTTPPPKQQPTTSQSDGQSDA